MYSSSPGGSASATRPPGPNQFRDGLSPSRRQLVERVGAANYGRVDNLLICGGEPVMDPPPRIVRTVKLKRLARASVPQPLPTSDFALKAQWVDLFAQMERIGDGTIALLEFAGGLPLFFEMETAAGGLAPTSEGSRL